MIADDNIYLELFPTESNSGERQVTAKGSQMTNLAQQIVPAPPGYLPRKPDNETISVENMYEEIPYNSNSGKKNFNTRTATDGLNPTNSTSGTSTYFGLVASAGSKHTW